MHRYVFPDDGNNEGPLASWCSIQLVDELIFSQLDRCRLWFDVDESTNKVRNHAGVPLMSIELVDKAYSFTLIWRISFRCQAKVESKLERFPQSLAGIREIRKRKKVGCNGKPSHFGSSSVNVWDTREF